MKVSCDIIRDLLPLYAENMVSQASRDMVDEHLRGCGECTGELGKLQKTEIIVPETDVSGLARIFFFWLCHKYVFLSPQCGENTDFFSSFYRRWAPRLGHLLVTFWEAQEMKP